MIRLIDSNGTAHPLSDYTDYHITHMLDGCDTMTFCVPTNHEQYQLLREEAIIRTDQNEYLIKKIDDDKVDCELNFDFLKTRVYANYCSSTRTLSAVLEDHLPSGWTVEGASVSTIRRTIEFDACTDYDVVYACIDTYSVKFIWHILEKRLVVVKPELMPSTGEYITSELNLESLSFKGESTSFATRLYAYGKDGLTLESAVVDGATYGKTYVENTAYASKVVCATWTDERYTIPEHLYEAAVEKLAEMAYPVRSYTCKVRDLAKADSRYSFLTFTMHRKLSLIDVERNIAVEHQIVEYDEWPDEENENTVTLSSVQSTIYDSIASEKDDLTARIAASESNQASYADALVEAAKNDLQSQIDKKVETWFYAGAPSLLNEPAIDWTTQALKTEHAGDLYFDTVGNALYRWSGSAWLQINDQAALDAAEAASEAGLVANGKATIYTGADTPESPQSGDLWLKSADDPILTYVDGEWTVYNEYISSSDAQSIADARANEALQTFVKGTYAADILNLQNQIDGAISTWFYAYEPTSENAPASNWTTDTEKEQHLGDLFYDTSTGYGYRWADVDGTYSWLIIEDTDVTKALAAAAKAQATADGKATVFTGADTPESPQSGDLWLKSADDPILTYVDGEWTVYNEYIDADDAKAIVDEESSAISEELSNRLNLATAMMTSAFGSHFYSSDGELYMMDSEDPSTAEVVWRWNVNGFAKSSTGIDGPYTTALTLDDTFFTGLIEAITIRGDLIEANTVSAEKIQQAYTDGVLSQAFTAAKGYVEALFTDLDTYLQGTSTVTVMENDIADIKATIDGISFDFSQSFRGGINYVSNSSGLNGLSDDWTYSGTVTTLQSSDTKNSTVSNSCFRLSTDAELSQEIDNVVLGRSYTVSCMVKKDNSLLSEVEVVYNGETVGTLFSSSSTTGWTECTFTIDSLQSSTLTIVCRTRSDYLYVADIMVNEGITSKAWTPAPDEIYTSGVKIDKSGIEVYRSDSEEKTVINNQEFAGYYQDEEVFSLNKDETRINKAVVRGQMTIEDTMFIPYESGEEKGLNITIVD